MVKVLFFEGSYYYHPYGVGSKYHLNHYTIYDIIRLIYNKYTLQSEKDVNVNLLINELRKDKDIMKKYNSFRYDIIDEDYYTAIDITTNETYKDFDIDIFKDELIDDLINLFDLKCILNCEDENSDNIYYCTNEKIIDIILSLENDVKYIVLNKYNFNIYYIEIQDEINKYIKFKYINPYYIEICPNKYTVLNNQSNQYLVINEDSENEYYNNDINFYNRANYIDNHEYLILYYDYDQYFKDNYKKYITKYKELFTLNSEFFDFEILIKSLNVIKNDNDLKNYVKYKIFLNKK